MGLKNREREMNRDRVLQNFLTLCKIHAESKKEQPVAHYLESEFSRLGYSVEYDSAHKAFDGESGNMIVRIPGTLKGPTLMLSAHMDTVVTGGNVEPIVDGEYVRSKGNTILGSDDRAGIAQIMEVIEILAEEKIPHLPLLIVITSAEEIGLLGARYCTLDSSDAQMGVILDTSGPIGKIVNAAPYHEAWKIKVHGRSAHAGIDPDKGINAIQFAAEIINRIPSGRIDHETTANVARIRGGNADNIVPALVTINGEARSRCETSLQSYIDELKTICEEVTSHWETECIFESEREYNGYHLEEESELISRLKRSAEVIGKEPQVMGTGGGSDANFFNEKGIPSAVISCGMAKVHTFKEEILLQDLYDTVEMILAFVCEK